MDKVLTIRVTLDGENIDGKNIDVAKEFLKLVCQEIIEYELQPVKEKFLKFEDY